MLLCQSLCEKPTGGESPVWPGCVCVCLCDVQYLCVSVCVCGECGVRVCVAHYTFVCVRRVCEEVTRLFHAPPGITIRPSTLVARL